MSLAPFQDLAAALKGALSGPLEALMLGLMKSTTLYDASELKASMKVRVKSSCDQSEGCDSLFDLPPLVCAGTGNGRGDAHRDPLLPEQRRDGGHQEGLQRKSVWKS